MTENEETQVHEGRRAGVVVSVRLKPDEADLLEAISERDGRTLSETLRVALHTFARHQPAQPLPAGRGIGHFTRGGGDHELETKFLVRSHA